MMRTLSLKLALAFGLGVAALGALPGTANAGVHFGGGFFFFHPRPHIFFGPRIFFGPHLFFGERARMFHPGPCHGLRERAQFTGDPYWWHQYKICRWNHGF